MNPILKKFVDQEFMSEKEAEYISQALANKESIIPSGHRSAGTRPFMASLMMAATKEYKTAQVKGFDDLEKEAEYLLIPGIAGIDFSDLILKAILQENKAMITLKEPEHPYSLFKLLRDAFKENGSSSKVYHLIECDKENDQPFVKKITRVSLNEKGRLVREDLE